MKLFYRYRNYIDNNDRTCLSLETYRLVRETRCYYMVKELVFFPSRNEWGAGGKEIRVPKDSKRAKRISHTKRDAWNGFLIRQQRRVLYAELNLKLAKDSIKYIKKNSPPDARVTELKKRLFEL